MGSALVVMALVKLPAKARGTSRVTRHAADFTPSNQVGVTQPLGFFDLLGFCKAGDDAGFRNVRTAEIKHGRVAMMAALGAVVQLYVKIPGFEDVPPGLAAVTIAPGSYGFAALFLLAGALELGAWKESPTREPGNFGDPLGLGKYDEEMRNRELNNGRLAMFAALGIVAAEVFTGKDGMQQLGLFAVRARASRIACRAADFTPSTQVGVTQPLGFFDPLGFCKAGDDAGFRNLRTAEIKHGRVAMMAALGAVVQHYVKIPGFEDVPPGLAAVTIAPGRYGFAALFLLAGALELGAWKESPTREPGNFGDPLGLGKYDEEMRNRELNNGRLAMFAALGIVAAEVFTGKDGMQQLGLFAVRERASHSARHAADFTPSTQVGVTQPLGFFDPLGFCKAGDDAGFRNLRTAEIKHGRVAMMAALGAVVQHYVKIPGFEHVPPGLAAVTTAPGSYSFTALFLVAGALELGAWKESPTKEPGNFGDPLGLGQYDEEMRNRELNHGRLAMFAALGIVAAEVFTGKDGIQQLGLYVKLPGLDNLPSGLEVATRISEM